MTLGGIIYLLSIADNRMESTTRRNIGMFHKLCGDKDLARVVLWTTNWGEVDEEVGKNREEQLVETFWNTMTASGSTRKSLRFDKTEKSARAFLDAILGQMKFGGNEEILDDNLLRTQKEGGNFDKVAPLSESTEKPKKKKNPKNLPTLILYSFFSLPLSYSDLD